MQHTHIIRQPLLQILVDAGPEKLITMAADPWMIYSSIASSLSKIISRWDKLGTGKLETLFNKKMIRYLLQVMEHCNVIADDKISHRVLVMIAFILTTLASNPAMHPTLRAAGTRPADRELHADLATTDH